MYREEYPRPSFARSDWQNLNGSWQIALGREEMSDAECLKSELRQTIEVPFCIESKLGGIEHKDFVNRAWYRRSINITEEQLKGRVIINFGAVDYEATLFVNKQRVGSHKGGYIAFAFDITDYLIAGKNVLDLKVSDDTQSVNIPTGKQSMKRESYGCLYTRTTGIWQTVWLEFVPNVYAVSRKITPCNCGKVTVELALNKPAKGEVKLVLVQAGKECASTVSSFNGANIKAEIKCDNPKLWAPESPTLYDINIDICTNGETDVIRSYVGFRKIEFKDGKFLLNGKPLFLRTILDQGFYPDGIYTAPTKEALEADIDLAMSFGFNGARPHQKVFEELYLYYADKKGYIIWSEFPNWGCEFTSANVTAKTNLINEWKEVVARDYNHPSIVGYCPLNEVWKSCGSSSCDAPAQKELYDLTKAYDANRPFIGSSGGNLFKTDVDDYHTYTHNTSFLEASVHNHDNGKKYKPFGFLKPLVFKGLLTKSKLNGLPIFLSEYGGIGYMADSGWGYNKAITKEDDFVNLFCALTDAAMNSDCFGLCYTQLTDVEQEQNGLVRYDRTEKLSPAAKQRIRNCLTKKAKMD